jgi:hypothetical protein
LCSHATGEVEWDQDTGEHGNQQYDTNHIQMPEKLHYKTLAPTGRVSFYRTRAGRGLGAAVDKEQNSDQGKGANWVDNGEHSITPLPGGDF